MFFCYFRPKPCASELDHGASRFSSKVRLSEGPMTLFPVLFHFFLLRSYVSIPSCKAFQISQEGRSKQKEKQSAEEDIQGSQQKCGIGQDNEPWEIKAINSTKRC